MTQEQLDILNSLNPLTPAAPPSEPEGRGFLGNLWRLYQNVGVPTQGIRVINSLSDDALGLGYTLAGVPKDQREHLNIPLGPLQADAPHNLAEASFDALSQHLAPELGAALIPYTGASKFVKGVTEMPLLADIVGNIAAGGFSEASEGGDKMLGGAVRGGALSALTPLSRAQRILPLLGIGAAEMATAPNRGQGLEQAGFDALFGMLPGQHKLNLSIVPELQYGKSPGMGGNFSGQRAQGPLDTAFDFPPNSDDIVGQVYPNHEILADDIFRGVAPTGEGPEGLRQFDALKEAYAAQEQRQNWHNYLTGQTLGEARDRALDTKAVFGQLDLRPLKPQTSARESAQNIRDLFKEGLDAEIDAGFRKHNPVSRAEYLQEVRNPTDTRGLPPQRYNDPLLQLDPLDPANPLEERLLFNDLLNPIELQYANLPENQQLGDVFSGLSSPPSEPKPQPNWFTPTGKARLLPEVAPGLKLALSDILRPTPDGKVKLGVNYTVPNTGRVPIGAFERAIQKDSRVPNAELDLLKASYPDVFEGTHVDIALLQKRMSEKPPLEVQVLEPSTEDNLTTLKKRLATIQHSIETHPSDFLIAYDRDAVAQLNSPNFPTHEYIPENLLPEDARNLLTEYRRVDSEVQTRAYGDFSNQPVTPSQEYSTVNPYSPEQQKEKGTLDISVQIPDYKHSYSNHGQAYQKGATVARTVTDTIPNQPMSKVMNVVEVQNDAANTIRKHGAAIEGQELVTHRVKKITRGGREGWTYTFADGSENIQFFTQDKEEAIRKAQSAANLIPSHPVIEHGNEVAMRAAINEAIKRGYTHVGVVEPTTAMMAEGHDTAAQMVRKLSVDDLIARRSGDLVGAERIHGKDWREGKYVQVRELPLRIDKPELNGNERSINLAKELAEAGYGEKEGMFIPQEKGMRFNYGEQLPAILQRLTGDRGRIVDFGTHAKSVKMPRATDEAAQFGNWGAKEGAGFFTIYHRRTGQNLGYGDNALRFDTRVAAEQAAIARNLAENIQTIQGSEVFGGKANITSRVYNLKKVQQKLQAEGALPIFSEPRPRRTKLGKEINRESRLTAGGESEGGEGDVMDMMANWAQPKLMPGEKLIPQGAVRDRLTGHITLGYNHANAYENALEPSMPEGITDVFDHPRFGLKFFQEGMVSTKGRFFDREQSAEALHANTTSLHSEDLKGMTKVKLDRGSIADEAGFINVHLATTVAGAGAGALIEYKKSKGDPFATMAGAVLGAAAGFGLYKGIEGMAQANATIGTIRTKAGLAAAGKEIKGQAKALFDTPWKDLAGRDTWGRGGVVPKFMRAMETWFNVHIPPQLKDAVNKAHGAGADLVDTVQREFSNIAISYTPPASVIQHGSNYLSGQFLDPVALRAEFAANGGMTLADLRKIPAAARPVLDRWQIGAGATRELWAIPSMLKQQILQREQATFLAALPSDHQQYGKSLVAAKNAFMALQDVTAKGLPDGKLKQIILGSKGQYTTRAYQAIHDPKYRPDPALVNQWMKEQGVTMDTSLIQRAINMDNGMLGTDYTALMTKLSTSAAKTAPARRARLSTFVKINHGGTDYYVTPDVRDQWQNNYNDEGLRRQLEQYLTDMRRNKGIFRMGDSAKKSIDTGILQKRLDLSPTFRELMGEYDDPLIASSITLAKLHGTARASSLISQIEHMQFDNGLSAVYDETAWTKHTNDLKTLLGRTTDPKQIAILQSKVNELGTYRKLDDNLKFGSLKGKLASRFVADQMEDYKGPWGMWESPVGRGLALYNYTVKTTRAPLNPITHVRNWVTMPVFAHIAQADPASLYQALQAVRTRNVDWQEMLRENIMGVDFISGEVRGSVQSIFSGQYDSELMKGGRKVINNIFKAYALPDQLVRGGAYLSAKTRFANQMRLPETHPDVIAAARQFTDRYTMNYASLPRAVKVGRQVPFVNIFISYSAEMGRLLKNLGEDATKGNVRAIGTLGALAFGMEAMQWGAEQALSDKDRKDWQRANRLSPDYSRTRYKIPLYREKNGNFMYVDLTPLHIANDYAQFLRGVFSGDGEAVLATNPIAGWQNTPGIAFVIEQATGENLRTHHKLRGLEDRAMAVGKEMVPPFIPPGFEAQKMLSIGQENLKTGRKETFAGTALRYGLGMNLTTVNPASIQRSALSAAKQDVANEKQYLNDVLKTTASPASKQRAIARYNDSVSHIWERYKRQVSGE